MIEVTNLTRHFGSLTAVNQADFTVESGQVFGFIGPNGAGKTTTLRILATLDTPDSGEARIKDYSIIKDPMKIRKIIGFLPDTFGVYKNMKVTDYIEFFGRSYGLRGTELQERIDYIKAFTDLSDLEGRRCQNLSAGMQQRLVIARTLINDPDILLLDEPAANLDPRARVEIRELIRELAELEKTILVSSHILAELSEICDALAIIEQGNIQLSGKVDDVLQEIRKDKNLKVRCINEDDTEVMSVIAEIPGVMDVSRDGSYYSVQFQGGEQEIPKLLSSFLDRDLDVVEIRKSEQNLEDVFMEVTEGDVQ